MKRHIGFGTLCCVLAVFVASVEATEYCLVWQPPPAAWMGRQGPVILFRVDLDSGLLQEIGAVQPLGIGPGIEVYEKLRKVCLWSVPEGAQSEGYLQIIDVDMPEDVRIWNMTFRPFQAYLMRRKDGPHTFVARVSGGDPIPYRSFSLAAGTPPEAVTFEPLDIVDSGGFLLPAPPGRTFEARLDLGNGALSLKGWNGFQATKLAVNGAALHLVRKRKMSWGMLMANTDTDCVIECLPVRYGGKNANDSVLLIYDKVREQWNLLVVPASWIFTKILGGWLVVQEIHVDLRKYNDNSPHVTGWLTMRDLRSGETVRFYAGEKFEILAIRKRLLLFRRGQRLMEARLGDKGLLDERLILNDGRIASVYCPALLLP